MTPRHAADTAIAVTLPATLPLLNRLSVGELLALVGSVAAFFAVCWRLVLWIRTQAVDANATDRALLFQRIDSIDTKLDRIATRADDTAERVATIEGQMQERRHP
jgi:hypothetical protein